MKKPSINKQNQKRYSLFIFVFLAIRFVAHSFLFFPWLCGCLSSPHTIPPTHTHTHTFLIYLIGILAVFFFFSFSGCVCVIFCFAFSFFAIGSFFLFGLSVALCLYTTRGTLIAFTHFCSQFCIMLSVRPNYLSVQRPRNVEEGKAMQMNLSFFQQFLQAYKLNWKKQW
jgi:hypothetical protein